MIKILLTILSLGIFITPAYANSRMKRNSENAVRTQSAFYRFRNGIVRVQSTYSIAETVQRFESFAKEQGLNIVAKVDHQAGATSVGKKLRPTQLIIFGNPRAGTLLMQCNQTAGIDLPQKALIWEDEKGQVWLDYNSQEYLFTRHQLKGCEPAIKIIEDALSSLAQKVTQ